MPIFSRSSKEMHQFVMNYCRKYWDNFCKSFLKFSCLLIIGLIRDKCRICIKLAQSILVCLEICTFSNLRGVHGCEALAIPYFEVKLWKRHYKHYIGTYRHQSNQRYFKEGCTPLLAKTKQNVVLEYDSSSFPDNLFIFSC